MFCAVIVGVFFGVPFMILSFLTQLDDVASSAFTQAQVMNRFMIDE
jgi:ABC-type sugar transport system permease subunit